MGRVNGKLSLSRSFGDFKFKKNQNLPYDEQMIICKPDIKEVDRDERDSFILMGCDGVWERYYENSSVLMDKIAKKIEKSEMKDILGDLLD